MPGPASRYRSPGAGEIQEGKEQRILRGEESEVGRIRDQGETGSRFANEMPGIAGAFLR